MAFLIGAVAACFGLWIDLRFLGVFLPAFKARLAILPTLQPSVRLVQELFDRHFFLHINEPLLI
jgi:hypothetical protein